jgi:hypothetical protein
VAVTATLMLVQSPSSPSSMMPTIASKTAFSIQGSSESRSFDMNCFVGGKGGREEAKGLRERGQEGSLSGWVDFLGLATGEGGRMQE